MAEFRLRLFVLGLQTLNSPEFVRIHQKLDSKKIIS